MTRAASFTLLLATSLISVSCGPRLAPRPEIPAGQAEQASYEQAYSAYWWNCALVKSLDLAAPCPGTCEGSSPAAACSAGATDAQNQIAELEKKYGAERTREILSRRAAEEDAHSKIESHFPYGPKRATD